MTRRGPVNVLADTYASPPPVYPAAELFGLLKARGWRIEYRTTCRHADRLLGTTRRAGRPGDLVPPAPPGPSARKLSFAFLCRAARDGDAVPRTFSAG